MSGDVDSERETADVPDGATETSDVGVARREADDESECEGVVVLDSPTLPLNDASGERDTDFVTPVGEVDAECDVLTDA